MLDEVNQKTFTYILETEDDIKVDEPMDRSELRKIKDEHYKEKIKKHLGKLAYNKPYLPSLIVSLFQDEVLGL